MTGIKTPRCPVCNLPTEFGFKPRSFTTAGVLKCPYNHHRVVESFGSSGSKEWMKSVLLSRWEEQIGNEQEGEKTE